MVVVGVGGVGGIRLQVCFQPVKVIPPTCKLDSVVHAGVGVMNFKGYGILVTFDRNT